MGIHLGLWSAGLLAALHLRFDGAIPAEFSAKMLLAWPILVAIRAVWFWRAGLFHGLMRYAGILELRAILKATVLGSLCFGMTYFVHRLQLPRTVYALELVLAMGTASGLRLGIRLLREGNRQVRGSADAPPAILFGAGNAGEMLLRDLHRSPTTPMRIVAIFDDDPAKAASLLHGIRVHGPIERRLVEQAIESTGARRAVLAMPTATGRRTREILQMCKELGLELKTVPSVLAIADGTVRVSQLRDVAIEDLLRRAPVQLDSSGISQALAGRRVLVTGAAGSIGSELVRQIAGFGPAKVILFDHSENGLFFLERELRQRWPNVTFQIAIGSIRDAQRVAELFAEARPHVVFHAAAHKHVPMMEATPAEAVKNNVVGTRIVADAAAAHGCASFVLISTDKAVNPTSVMGATKRIAEMYVQSLNERFATRFVAVRFGNVLGSAGSVVPIFRAQIEAGRPVQVTHPEMRRFFMTIPEATQLVLQAGVLAKGGEIFVLDMGEAIRIVDLARDLISLSGLRPEIDIPIEFTGTRPGEKLYEELMHPNEVSTTSHPQILVGRIPRVGFDSIRTAVERLERVASAVSATTIRAELSQIVPEATLGAQPSETEPRSAAKFPERAALSSGQLAES